MTRPWPSREEWAEQRRTLYYDQVTHVSDGLSDYATPDEVAAMRPSLDGAYRDLGRRLKVAKQAAGPLCRQPGETRGQQP